MLKDLFKLFSQKKIKIFFVLTVLIKQANKSPSKKKKKKKKENKSIKI